MPSMSKRFLHILSACQRKVGLFWRFLFAMFVASLAGTLLFIWGGNLYDHANTVKRLAPERLQPEVARKFDAVAPTLEAAGDNLLLCQTVLKGWGNDEFAVKLLNDGGPNTWPSLVKHGRIQFRYLQDGRPVCRYPDLATPVAAAGEEALTATAEHTTAAGAKQTMQVTIVLFTSWELLWVASTDFPWLLFPIFVIVLNLCSALVLAPLLVRRIRRAEAVARGWTEGSMQARIVDNRNDEFGNLVRSFNHLADSFVEVIATKQELAAMEERNRLARELHDTAKQRAFALNLQLTALNTLHRDDPQVSRMTHSALSLVQHLQSDLSNVIRRLSSTTIAEVGIRQVLSHEVGALFEGTGMRWEIDIADDIDATLREVPYLAQQVLLIGMEASANVLKHASARSLVLRIRRDDARYALTVEDDGVGIGEGADHQGMGVANMRLRARGLPSGAFSLLSKSGGGALVTVGFSA